MRRLHYIQHVPFESPGSILELARSNNTAISGTRMYSSTVLPDMDEFDLLVVMGGPMGVDEVKEYPWLKDEKSFINRAIEEGKIVLGICLGAQLIADVLGSKVARNRYKEIGWYPIWITPEGRANPITGFLPNTMKVFHWHGDTFELPPGAERIAISEGCENQGFIYGDRVIGLQFHLEVTKGLLRDMTLNGKGDLGEGRFVQDEQTILSNQEFIRINNLYLETLLANLGVNE